jgi:hypothetical protein
VREVNHSVHLVPRLGMCGAISLLPYTPSWRGQRKLYRNFSCLAHYTHVSFSVVLMTLPVHNSVRSDYLLFSDCNGRVKSLCQSRSALLSLVMHFSFLASLPCYGQWPITLFRWQLSRKWKNRRVRTE